MSKVEAAARLLAAEAEYLRACGWEPMTLRDTEGVYWTIGGNPPVSTTQEEALRWQKHHHHWPHVKEEG